MAQEVNLIKNNIIKKGYVGFSWTMLFFSFFVPLIRGDWKWLGIILGTYVLLSVLTAGYGGSIVGIIFAFMYNKFHIIDLLEGQRYEPATDRDRQLLVRAGILKS